MNPADFASIIRADGTNQVTYRGRPLYYYSGDTVAGDIKGEGFNYVWHAATLSGIIPVFTVPLTATLSLYRIPVPSSGNGGGGGGYGGGMYGGGVY